MASATFTLTIKSSGHYRGVDIFEVIPGLFAVTLGYRTYTFISKSEATAFIDAWYLMRVN